MHVEMGAREPMGILSSRIGFSPYITLERDEWARLRDTTPLPLTEEELAKLRGINENISLAEVEAVYLPLSRLLNLYVANRQKLYQATRAFLNNTSAEVPYIIGIAGSVAVGKSTTARIIQALLKRWPNHPKVDLVTTDGFLYPNRVLEARGLMSRKGFPESYDIRRLLKFVADVKSGKPEVTAPVYSHLTYDIVPGEYEVIRQPDIVILEGLNVLQTGTSDGRHGPRVFISDFFDFSIYVDADVHDIEEWYVERFQTLRRTTFRDENSYFHRYATLSDAEAEAMARQIWHEINEPNLYENIAPTKARADLVLEKGPGHTVQRVHLRKL
ncbi:type I pantothenate kinase [Alicyclobacillus herbarius]|uniref:type I pantothenate kinase n=1 Tax=Alicyclobacillus herbarius TaxID=122960 RepID=UPI0023576501|nr:type I pantothenate kinase [Alicyclobacillus herbarius]